MTNCSNYGSFSIDQQETFKKAYYLEKEISIDKSMICFKGRLSFLQYLPKKFLQNWGVKAWVLAESATGYTWNFLVYAGKENNSNDGALLGKRVVFELPKSLWNKGHHVYSSNFYTSPSLCLKLEEKGTGCCGTVWINRKVSQYPFNR